MALKNDGELAKKDRETFVNPASLEWILTKKRQPQSSFVPSYGDLTQLNQNRLILDSVGKNLLEEIVKDYLYLLDSSAAVYEKNGDYALGIFSSGWCRFMDQASRNLCQTEDNFSAMRSGKWLCHESCWTKASRKAIDTESPVDIECQGGLRLYAVPIVAAGSVVGAMNFGYGDPPTNPIRLQSLAARFRVKPDQLAVHAFSYESRPAAIVELARRQMATSARLIGEIVGRHLTQKALRQSEETFRMLFEQAPLSYQSLDRNGIFLAVNQTWLDVLGYHRREVIGKKFYDFLDPGSRAAFEHRFTRFKARGETAGVQFKMIKKDGSLIQASFHGKIAYDRAGSLVTHCILTDMTQALNILEEKKRLEDRLHQLQKRETPDTLAGGTAHDFNNLLYPIIVLSELLLEDLSAGSRVHEMAQMIYDSAQKARDLVKQIPRF